MIATVTAGLALTAAAALIVGQNSAPKSGNDAAAPPAQEPAPDPADKPAAPAAGQGAPAMPPALVRTAVVTTESLQPRFSVVGRLQEVNRVIVPAEQTGKLVEVKIEGGMPVVAGETVLARVENTWVDLAMAQAKANLAVSTANVVEAEARLSQAKRDHEYVVSLIAKGSAKQKEVDDAQTTERAAEARLAGAKAQVEVAKAQIDVAQTQMSKLAVVAPFDGVVVKKLAEVGLWAERGTPVAEIVSRGRIDAVVDVPEQYVNYVEKGDQIDVFIDPLNVETVGKVAGVIPLGSTPARTFPVKVRLDDLGGRLKSGMSATAAVPIGQQTAHLTVPRDAVLRSARDAVVWAVVDDKAVRVPVEVLFAHADRFAVNVAPGYSGLPLRDGMSVVIEGGERLLFPGQAVKVMAHDAVAESIGG